MAHRLSPVAFSFLAVLTFTATLSAQTPEAAPAEPGVSKVRIVRISETKGVVHVDRNAGRGFEAAMTNLPIVENCRIRTDAGAVEVEFEDNSTLRLAPDSLAVFSRLDRLASGETATSVHLIRGTAYISLIKAKANQFTLAFGSQSINLAPGTHVRIGIEQDQATLAVLDGSVHIDGTQALDVPKKRTAVFSMVDSAQPELAAKVSTEPFDEWDKNATGYHARAAAYTSSYNSPYSYGLSDMAYYGGFNSYGSCGNMWRPYFASAAWDPYSNGAWAWYNNAGYSWVSPYPWGWTAYHSGNWAYCPNAGWGWQPNGGWNGLNNIAAGAAALPRSGGVSNPIGIKPIHPPHPPRPGEPTITAVNLKPLVRSELTSQENFLFRKDSAGLGIPRETLGKLDKISRESVTRGIATTRIYMSTPSTPGASGRTGNGGGSLAPVTIHRGSAPSSAPTYSAGTNSGNRGNGGNGGNISSGNSSSPAPVSRGGSMGGSSGGSPVPSSGSRR